MEHKYDAFISYAEPDADWVRDHLLIRLREAGLNTIREDDFQPGVPRLLEIERSIRESRHTLLVLTPNYLLSNYQGFESILTSTLGLDTGTWPAVPLIVEPCDLPPRLSALVAVDLRDGGPGAWERLLAYLDPNRVPDSGLEPEQSPPAVFHGVPAMPSQFLGREILLASIVETLISTDVAGKPSVAAVGQGGIGKTTLAIAVARNADIWAQYRDGVLWAGLGVTADLEAALIQWGDALGLHLSDVPSLDQKRGAIQSAIGNRQFLIVLDDAWEVEPALGLKIGGPNTAYLLTTRNQSIARAFADRGRTLPVLELEEEMGYALLQEHAPRACEADPEAARALVREVGGLPIALELLGKYLAEEGSPMTGVFQHLDLEAMQKMAEAPSRMELAVSRLGGKGGQHSLKQMLELSLEDLPEDAVEAFYTLGAFPPKPAVFDQEAAVAVTQAELKSLAMLITASLVEVDNGQFTIHQSLSDLARERMPDIAQSRHRAYYLELLGQDKSDWHTIQSVYRQLQWGWAQNPPDPTKLEWIEAVHQFQNLRGLWGDYRAWLNWGLEFARGEGDRWKEADYVDLLGIMFDRIGQPTKALEFYEKAQLLREELGDREGLARTLNNIGMLHRLTGDLPKALAYYERALPIREEVGDRIGLAATLNNIGLVHRVAGDPDKALEYYEKALSIREAVGDREGLAVTLNNIGFVYREAGDADKALEFYERALPIREEVGDRAGQAATLNNIGKMYLLLNQQIKAQKYFEKALQIWTEIRHRYGESITRYNIANVLWNNGDRIHSVTELKNAIGLAEKVQSPRTEKYRELLTIWESYLSGET